MDLWNGGTMRNKIMQYVLYFLGLEILSYQTYTGTHSNLVFSISVLLFTISLTWDIVYLIKKRFLKEK